MKRIRYYDWVQNFHGVGHHAIFGLTGTDLVAITTAIVSYDETMEIFETENSVYVPA